MDENNNETTQPQAPAANTPAETAVEFVNAEVLAPPTASPMGGVAKVMIEQSAGMMVQDLQSFLKGFEQVGLIALSRLANNLLTYGSPSGPKSKSSNNNSGGNAKSEAEMQDDFIGSGSNDMIKDLFKIVSDYAEAKTKISGAIYNPGILHPTASGMQNSSPFTSISAETEDPEKKNG
ncbi:hypothetical protein [Chryseobacterium daeguense]|uniref:hypothetical protein n=1 Tax=Chryseobacterium daeguense TaxID=412438 RepID=UPI00041F4B99|nr:hypothetical protein [Chryseobacterium daeguense]